jgi:hypothetical protein
LPFVEQAFDEAFAGDNKSAVMTPLMRDAVARVHEQRVASPLSHRRRPAQPADALVEHRQAPVRHDLNIRNG